MDIFGARSLFGFAKSSGSFFFSLASTETFRLRQALLGDPDTGRGGLSIRGLAMNLRQFQAAAQIYRKVVGCSGIDVRAG